MPIVVSVLYLSYDGMTDPLGQSQVIPYLAGLTGRGYRFHLVSFEKPAMLHREHAHILSLLRDYDIQWHPMSYTKKPPVISTMRDLQRMKKKAAEIIAANDIRIIHCRSYIAGLAGMALAASTGARFLFDMRGFWADERVEGGIWNLANPIYKAVYRFFKQKEKQMISSADAVVCLTSDAKEIIGTWQLRTGSQRPLDVIPCCADLEHFTPDAVDQHTREHIVRKLNLPPGSKVLSYLGAIGTWYMLDDMLRFFAQLLEQDPAWIFLFITHEHAQTLHKAMAVHGIHRDSVRILSARRNEVPAALSLSDAAIFFIKPVFSKRASSPTKQGEIMGMGIPIICNSGIGDTDSVIERYGCGAIVDLSDPQSARNVIADMNSVLSIPPEKIRQGAYEFYSLESGVARYETIYRDLTGINVTGGDTALP